MLDPIPSGRDIGCVKSDLIASFDAVKALATDAMLNNHRIFHNMKFLFFNDRVTVNGIIIETD